MSNVKCIWEWNSEQCKEIEDRFNPGLEDQAVTPSHHSPNKAYIPFLLEVMGFVISHSASDKYTGNY